MMKRTTYQKRSPHLPSTPEPTPWLVFPNGEGAKKLTFFNVSDPNRKNYVRSFPEIREKVCVASMHGWLIMNDLWASQQVVLWNPDTREIIHLPSLNEDDLEHCGHWILSSPPSDPDCMVVFVGQNFFLIWRLGYEKWVKQHYQLVDESILAVISCTNGNIYGYTRNSVAVIDRENCGILSVRLLAFNKYESCCDSNRLDLSLVESCGEIYFVVTHYVGCFNPTAIKHVEIFKMDFSKEVFQKVECLGDCIFFISKNSSVSFSATKLGLKGNCVYLTLAKDNNLYVFDLEDESLSVYLPCPNLLTPSFSPFWYTSSNSRLNEFIENGDRENENTTTKEELKTKTTNTQVTIVNMEESERCHCIDLPMDILGSIAMHLPLAEEYLNFRLVCKTISKFVPPIRLPTQYPLLMFSNRGKRICTFFDPMKDVHYCLDMPELLGATIRFSKDGWLLMRRDCSMFFFNPFTKVTIELPDLPRRVILQGLSFSSTPTSPDCIIFGILWVFHQIVEILFVRLGEEAWTSLHFEDEVHFFPSDNNPVFYDGAFYCLGVKRYLGIFDPRYESWTVLHTPRPCSSIHQNYLVECNREIISIFVGREGKYVRAYKLDHSNMNWENLSSLKDQMLFVSRSTSISLKAIPEMQNMIYFPISFNNKNNCLFYSLETQSWNFSSADYFLEDLYSTKERLHCTWIQPTLS